MKKKFSFYQKHKLFLEINKSSSEFYGSSKYYFIQKLNPIQNMINLKLNAIHVKNKKILIKIRIYF